MDPLVWLILLIFVIAWARRAARHTHGSSVKDKKHRNDAVDAIIAFRFQQAAQRQSEERARAVEGREDEAQFGQHSQF